MSGGGGREKFNLFYIKINAYNIINNIAYTKKMKGNVSKNKHTM